MICPKRPSEGIRRQERCFREIRQFGIAGWHRKWQLRVVPTSVSIRSDGIYDPFR